MRLVWLAVAVAAVAGCRKAPPTEVPIKGEVKGPGGQALAGVIVRFHGQADKAGAQRTVSCPTGPGGAFEGRCPPGTYKVTLLAVPRGGGPDTPEMKAPGAPAGVPAAYASVRETPWEVEVPEGGKDDIRLEVGR